LSFGRELEQMGNSTFSAPVSMLSLNPSNHPWTLATAILLVLLLGGIPRAAAQQGGFAPLPAVTHYQRGAALEVPGIPAQNSKNSLDVPQLSPQRGPELELPSRTLQIQSSYAQATVTVTDQSRRYVTGLQKDDFRLYIEGIQRPIEFLRQDLNTPVSVGILVDTSDSMEPKILQARTAIAQFIGELNSRDDIFLLAFSSHPFLLQPLTMNHSLVSSRLAMLYAHNDTALFDTIMDGLIMIGHGRYDKKALLVVTDGMDNASKAALPQVVAEARQMGVLIYSIGIGDPSTGEVGYGIAPFILAGNRDHVDARTLRELSTESGARTYMVSEVGDGALLREDCEEISNELREQYTVGFLVPDPSHFGYRDLRVKLPGKPDFTVRVRKGLTVGTATESAYAEPDTTTR
jgi:Ca-activated chloride channel homolog